ncbi:OmpH family outer membrane protein [bacterium]|nr:OmpH family outer membrane protein [bacterium]
MRVLILALAAVLSFITVSSAQTVKIGYVKVDVLLHEFSDFNNAQVTLQTEAQKWQAELEKYQKDLNTLQENYRQKASLVSPEKQREMQAEMMQKNQEAQKYQQDIFGPDGVAEKRKNSLMQPINDKVNRAIEAVGARDKYTILLNAESLLYAADGIDATDDVLKVLQSGAAAPAAGAAKSATTKTGAPAGAGPRR